MATVDGDGRPWCSALVGPPGSFTVPEPTRVALERAAARATIRCGTTSATIPGSGCCSSRSPPGAATASTARFRELHLPPQTHTQELHLPPRRTPFPSSSRCGRRCPTVRSTSPAAISPSAGDGKQRHGRCRASHGRRRPRRRGAAHHRRRRRLFRGLRQPAGPARRLPPRRPPGFVELRGEELWVPDYPATACSTRSATCG